MEARRGEKSHGAGERPRWRWSPGLLISRSKGLSQITLGLTHRQAPGYTAPVTVSLRGRVGEGPSSH